MKEVALFRVWRLHPIEEVFYGNNPCNPGDDVTGELEQEGDLRNKA